MKFNLFTTELALVALLFAGMSCTNSNKNKEAENTKTEQKEVVTFMEVDDLLKAEGLVNKEVKVQGVCTHICAHGGGKIFLMGSDDTQTIRVEAAALGSFDKKCVNSIVKVTGILKEQRIDENYLQQWEAQEKDNTAKKHGEEEGGCASEKAARGETANSTADRIADFRKKIEARKAKDGKDYLSFYYIEAQKYEIE